MCVFQVVEWCCQCITHLSSSVEAQDTMVAHGAVERLLDALSYFNKQDSREHIQVQVQVIRAVASLVLDNANIKLHMEQVSTDPL